MRDRSTDTEAELLDEYDTYMRELGRLTGGHVNEAFFKANSMRLAWVELRARGLDDKRIALDEKYEADQKEAADERARDLERQINEMVQ